MSKAENSEGLDKEIDLKNYEDQTGLSEKKLNFGLWIAENRRKIMKIIIISLVAISAFFFIYSSYNYIIYFISGDPNAQIISNNLTVSPRKVTEDLSVSSVRALANDGRYDLTVQISNPNAKFMANFDYCFKKGETDIVCGSSFILPGETKHVVELAQPYSGSISEISFSVSGIFWRRIDTRQIPDWAAFFGQRLDFAIFDLNYAPASVSGLSDKVNLNTLDFSIKNQTAYGYYEAPLDIFLYSGSEMIAVNRYILKNFLPGETRTVKLSWPGQFVSVNRTEVVPNVNIMDDSVYLKYQGITGN